MAKGKEKDSPLEYVDAYDFFHDEEGSGAIILYRTGRIEVLSFQDMLDKGINPELFALLQAEYMELFGRGEAWPLCDYPGLEDDFHDLDIEIQRFINLHVEFIDDGYCSLLSHWVIVSYFTEFLTHFPRLVFYGTTHSGKSRGLRILSLLAFRGDNAANSTGPATFRDIEDRRLSSIIDEYQRLGKERRPDMDSIFIAGFDKNGCVKRVGEDGRVNRYWPWGPMAIGYKGGKLDEDMENRAILINMAQKSREDVARQVDTVVARGLRSRLMALRYRALTHPEEFKIVFDNAWAIAERPYMTKVGEIILDDRTIDMAANIIVGSLFIGGKEADIDDDLRLFAASQLKAKETLRDSFEGQVFHALLEVLVGAWGKNSIVVETDVTGISTTDVADQLNNDLREQGNDHHDAVKTVRVGNALRAMNFTTKPGGQNKSYFVQNHDKDNRDTIFYPNLRRNLKKYGSGALGVKLDIDDRAGEENS